jgi:hypothetical protein
MSGVDHHIRYLALNARESLSAHYVNRGSEFGYALARRITVEMVDHVREVHGKRVAFEMISGIGDRMIKGTLYEPAEDAEMRGIMAALLLDEANDGKLLPPEGPIDNVLGDGDWGLVFPVNSPNVIAHDAPAAADQLVKLRPYVRYLEGEIVKAAPRWQRIARSLMPPTWFWTLVLGYALAAAGR